MGFGSYGTAWLMCHKVRLALIEDIERLGGIVEADETYDGGSNKNSFDPRKFVRETVSTRVGLPCTDVFLGYKIEASFPASIG
jgi:hypothetical protein